MPAKLQLELKKNNGQKYNYSMAALLQGILMEKISPDYASQLHESGLHPYSQYLSFERDRMIWNIQTLTKEAEDQIIDVFASEEKLQIKQRQETIDIVSSVVQRVSEQNLLKKYYFGECDSILRLRFLTPTSFKQNGRYMIYPDVRLIFQSLMKKYDAGSRENKIFSEEILEEFENHIGVVGYNLRSTYYYTDHVRIPSFIGTLTLKIRGPQQMANLAWFLAEYGVYSGVGIKTGLGMGAMTVLDGKERRKKDAG